MKAFELKKVNNFVKNLIFLRNNKKKRKKLKKRKKRRNRKWIIESKKIKSIVPIFIYIT